MNVRNWSGVVLMYLLSFASHKSSTFVNRRLSKKYFILDGGKHSLLTIFIKLMNCVNQSGFKMTGTSEKVKQPAYKTLLRKYKLYLTKTKRNIRLLNMLNIYSPQSLVGASLA